MHRKSFTLIELLLVIGIIAVIAGIVILAINPSKQLSKAQDAKRESEMNQLQKALVQFSIDKGTLPDAAKFSKDPGNPTPICSQNATDTAICVDATPLVAQYIAAIPKDPTELCSGVTGYGAYVDRMGPHVVQKHDDDLSSCPVSLYWSDSTHVVVRNGMATLTGSLIGKTVTVSAGASLNLNGHNVTGGSIANNGTIVALGTETADVAGGAWKIVGTGSLNVLGNQGTLSSLALAPTAAGTVFKPTTALTVSGQLTVGSTAILDTTVANSTFNGAVQNNGAIIIGDNAVHFNGGYDAQNGQTVFVGTSLPPLTYHDLQINSANASIVSNATVNGSLTVNSGKTLTINAGKTLTIHGAVNVSGTLKGAGTLDLGNGGQSITISGSGLLTGIDAAHLLTLQSVRDWMLHYTGTGPLLVSYLNITHGTADGTVSCSGCTGGTGNIHTCLVNHYWDGTQCANGNCLTSENCANGFACVNHTCKTSCSQSIDCATGYSCVGGSCQLGSFTTCSTSDNCATDQLCTNGVCCTAGTQWNGTQCVACAINDVCGCPVAFTWQGTECSWCSPSQVGQDCNCPLGQNWDGYECCVIGDNVVGSCCGTGVQGLKWDGNECVSCDESDAGKSCGCASGQYWDGTECACYDHNLAAHQYDCTLCGNGVLDAGEQCDDGNIANGDGCSETCTVELAWACDGASPSHCHGISCGNGVIDAGETCDDANLVAGDGCTNCQLDLGYEYVCAFNPYAGHVTCMILHCPTSSMYYCTACGNGLLDAGEQCDDHNTVNGDGCDTNCHVESGWTCNGGPPSVCHH